MTDPDSPAEGSCNLCDFLGVRPAQGHGNLHDYVLTRVHRLYSLFAVQWTRGRNKHQLHERICKGRFCRSARTGEAPTACEIASGFFGARDNPPREDAAELLVGLQVPLSDCSGTDNTKTNGL